MALQAVSRNSALQICHLLILAAVGLQNSGAQPVEDIKSRGTNAAFLERNGGRNASPVHDPSTIVKCKDEYWLFHTGLGVSSWRSRDLVRWERGPRVFERAPDWTTNITARQRGNFWAPDVIFHEGRYWLYYSVSQFGVNASAIGLASNPTLDPADKSFHWTDHGMVIQTRRTNNFNAIDPQVIKTPGGQLWLSFGSFWSGIKLIQLDPKTGLRLAPDAPIHSLAYHKDIEAAAIQPHDGWYYLFVNWGTCCRGVNSTYEMRVGRSREITGPYLDKDGRDMMQEGGTVLLGSDGAFIGPGHAGIFEEDGKSWLSCHFYDGTRRGAATLAVRPLQWDSEGWPALPVVAATRPSGDNLSSAEASREEKFRDTVPKPLRVFIRSGAKTHGPGMHDHPKFLADWTKLLNDRGAKCEGGNQFPTAEQLSQTDVLLIYCADGGDLNAGQRTSLTNFLAKGGGLVTLLDGVCGHDPQWWKTIVGAAWEYNRTKWQYTKLKVRMRDANHPVTAGAMDFELDDEVYDGLHVIPEAHVLAEGEFPQQPAAADVEASTKTIPQMWALEKDSYRAFTWIQGLRVKTFDVPQYRALLLRGIAWAGKQTEVNKLCTPEELKALKQ